MAVNLAAGQFPTELLVGVLGAIAAVGAAAIPYFLAKRNELQLEMKKTKLERYDKILDELTAYVNNPNEESAYKFILAYNRSTSYVTTDVLEACEILLKELDTPKIMRRKAGTSGGDPVSLEETIMKNKPKVVEIFRRIRQDINPKERYYEFDVYIGTAKNI